MLYESKVSAGLFSFEKDLLFEINNCTVQHFEKGEKVIKHNNYVKFLPLLIDGSLRVYSQTDQREILYYYIQNGETCGLSLGACLENKKSSADIEAAKSSSVLLVPAQKVMDWQRIYSSWNLYIIQTITRRQQQLLDTFGQVAFSKMEKRIKDYFCLLLKDCSSATISMTHQELANELGTTRVVISRILKNMEVNGIVELVRGAIKIKKLACPYHLHLSDR